MNFWVPCVGCLPERQKPADRRLTSVPVLSKFVCVQMNFADRRSPEHRREMAMERAGHSGGETECRRAASIEDTSDDDRP